MSGAASSFGWTPPRRFGGGNWRGLWTLYRRGMTRYFRFALEDVGGPIVSALLFLSVFVVALPKGAEMQPGVTAEAFLAPGIVILSVLMNAFSNAAFPILFDKMEGMAGDIVMAPLSPVEMLLGYLLPAVSGALLTGLAVVAAVALFVDLPLAAPGWSAAFAVAAAALFAVIGFLTGLWALKWDHFSAVQTFMVLPLGLLSGTFFTVEDIPRAGADLIRANPVYYAVDGFRGGFTGTAAESTWFGLVLILALTALLFAIAWRLVAIGWKIKA